MLTLAKLVDLERELKNIELLYEQDKLDEAIFLFQQLDSLIKVEIQPETLSQSNVVNSKLDEFYKSFESFINTVSHRRNQVAQSLSGQIQTRKKINVYQKIKG